MPATTWTGRAPTANELTEALQEALASPAFRPPVLPSVALEIMSLSGVPDVDLGEVVKLLERDPVLAGRVLALAQSARYSRRARVVTLRQAAVRLGLETLVHLVLQAALALRIFRAPGFEELAARVNRHATAVAYVTRDLCRRAGTPGEHAFMAGLLHDIGLPTSLALIGERPDWRRLPPAALAPALDAVHADVSGLLARHWKLPDPLPAILASHHSPVLGGKPEPTLAALIVAEQLCWEAGAGVAEPPPDATPLDAELREQPMDGLDATWPGVVRQALGILRLDASVLAAARVCAFDTVASLGPAPGAPP